MILFIMENAEKKNRERALRLMYPDILHHNLAPWPSSSILYSMYRLRRHRLKGGLTGSQYRQAIKESSSNSDI